jgi:hypothetical protein
MNKAGRLVEYAALALAAVALGWQLFVPPAAGVADNGDYPRIMGRFRLDHPSPDPQDRYFNYLNLRYRWDPAGGWDSGLVSSELPLAWIAVQLDRPWSEKGWFDLRWLALVHSVLLVAAFWLILRSTRGLAVLPRTIRAVCLVLVFCDVGYVAYFNSFYSEPASFIFAFFVVGLTLRVIAGRRRQPWEIPALLAAALLFASAKPQNSLLGVILGLWSVRLFWVLSRGWRRRLAVGAALLVSVLCVVHYNLTPRYLKYHYFYQAVFFDLLKNSPSPAQDLTELGLDPGLAKYAGTHYFTPGAPVDRPEFQAGFFERMDTPDLIGFYARHPARLVALLERISRSAFTLRPDYLGNFERKYGFPPGTQSHSFQTWSSLKARFLPARLWFLAAFFALSLAAALAVWRGAKSQEVRLGAEFYAVLNLLWAAQFIIVAGSGEYEVVKHLFLFELLFDICFWTGIIALASLRGLKRA